MYGERFYRERTESRFRSFRVEVGESDLWIGFTDETGGATVDERTIKDAAARRLVELRSDIQHWASTHPDFYPALDPLPDEPSAPPIVRSMLKAGISADVGPMAAVAGAIAEHLGRRLADAFGLAEIVIENGGDLWLSIREPLTIAVYAGLSSLSEKIGIVVGPELSPCGVATSSGTVGPSLSYGKADAALAVARDAAVSDAWATALGNRCVNWGEAERAVPLLVGVEHPELLGALVVMADKLTAAGAVRLAPLRKTKGST